MTRRASMKIRTIDLSWFRGAAEDVSLQTGHKSVVVYGSNGAGKSSFVDAIAYAIDDGKLRHLQHEYSGHNQLKGLRNTDTPDQATVSLRIELDDGSEYLAVIPAGGSASRSGTAVVELTEWDYHRTILRQDEVADFIKGTKGDKYSVLLPLLGLQPLEYAAENLRQIEQELRKRSKVEGLRGELSRVRQLREERLDSASDDDLARMVADYHEQYRAGQARGTDLSEDCSSILAAISARISALNVEQSRHFVISEISKCDMTTPIAAVREIDARLATEGTSIANKQLEVLKSARLFADALTAEQGVEEPGALKCPACGQSIDFADFRLHVEQEERRLGKYLKLSDERIRAVASLCDQVQQLKQSFEHESVASWRKSLEDGDRSEHLQHLGTVDIESLRRDCSDADLEKVEKFLLPLIDTAADAAKTAPPDVDQIGNDREAVSLIAEVLESEQKAIAVEKIDALVSFVKELETGVRREIRERTQAIVAGLTEDIQRLWARLHPNDAITNVGLHMPDDAEKAIDIHLRFHEKEQDSPRLTLSEGYRNSLGLCIFLALALQDNNQRPLILDDVVVSLDREHRGMVVELLEAEFADRQILLFTHDREWFADLRRQLDESRWDFRILLPYENPTVGIRWSTGDATFADARAYLANQLNAAGNTARTIMQTEMSATAEAVHLRLPHLRGDRNDKRNPDEILTQFIAVARSCFQRKGDDGAFAPHAEAIDAFESARKLLVTWANSASHGLDITRSEVEKLIAVCEAAIQTLRCSNCDTLVSRLLDTKSDVAQCRCGVLRWRFGKDN